MKRFLKNASVRLTACWIAANYIRLVWHTGSWTVVGKQHIDSLYENDQPGIVCFWHGRLMMMPYGWQRPKSFHMLISAHRDGELIANTVKHLGISWIKGSSSKGGAQAFRSLLKALKAGEYVGMTPDGPRGPRMRASDGIIMVARMSGAPILPLTYGARSGKVLGSWDRFLVAMPFSKGVLEWGEPIYVPRDADAEELERYRLLLEDRMNTMTASLDEQTNRSVVQPDSKTWQRLV